MKSLFVTLLLCLVTKVMAQTVQPVYDRGKIGLWRAVYKGKRECTPEWLFTLIPSWRRYRNKDHQNAAHLLPIWWAMARNQEDADEEREDRAEYANERLHDALDRSLNAQWELKYKNIIPPKITEVLTIIWDIEEAAESDYPYVENYMKENLNPIMSDLSQILRGYIDRYQAIGKSYIPDSKKKQAFDQILDDMDELKGKALMLRVKFKAVTKIKEVQFLKNNEL